MRSSYIKNSVTLFIFLFSSVVFYPQNAFASHGGVFSNNYACHTIDINISGCSQVSCTSSSSSGSAYASKVSYSNSLTADGECNTAVTGTITQTEYFTDNKCKQAYIGFCPERCKTNLSCGVGGICAAIDYKDSPAFPETVEGI